MSFRRFAFYLAMAAAGLCYAQQTQTAPARHELKMDFPPGKQWVLVQEKEWRTNDLANFGHTKKEFGLTADNGKDAPTWQMTYRRIEYESRYGATAKVDRSDTAGPSGDLYRHYLDMVIKGDFDNRGKFVVKDDGLRQMALKSLKVQTLPASVEDQLKKAKCDLQSQLDFLWAYLPDSPKGVGDVWRIKRKDAYHGEGNICHEDVTLKLKEVKQTEDGEIAVVSAEGKADAFHDGKPVQPEEFAHYQIEGELAFNLTTKQLTEATWTLTGKSRTYRFVWRVRPMPASAPATQATQSTPATKPSQ